MSELDNLPPLGDIAARTMSLSRTSSHASAPKFRLRCQEHGEHVSDGNSLVVGSHPSATWVLKDRSVSRFHCEISCHDDGTLSIRDLGSRNGTYVNGVRVERAWLSKRARIQLGRTTLEFEVEGTVQVPISDESNFGEMVGSSAAIRKTFNHLQCAAKSDISVLLHGETGTGKELAADGLHSQSPRKDGPFIIVDCGSMPEQLMQSELFGHAKGAFTGADTERKGAFEAANGGTIFLDEIGELPLALQPVLLRVLESRTVCRVGESHHRPVDVRVVAATHRDLKQAVNEKTFRSDLYYRLAVFTVEIPPLRQRKDDIPMLAARLIETMRLSDEGRRLVENSDFIASLSQHSWPGNVRELRNHLEMSALRGSAAEFHGGVASADGGNVAIDTGIPLRTLKEQWVARLERGYLQELMEETDSNVSEISRRSGMSRMQLYRLMQKHGLRNK